MIVLQSTELVYAGIIQDRGDPTCIDRKVDSIDTEHGRDNGNILLLCHNALGQHKRACPHHARLPCISYRTLFTEKESHNFCRPPEEYQAHGNNDGAAHHKRLSASPFGS